MLNKGAELIGEGFYQDQFYFAGMNSPILFQVKFSVVLN